MHDELIKRVRQVAEEVCEDYDVDPYNAEQRFFIISEAADVIEALSKENERLRKAVLRYEDELGILDKLPLVDQREQEQEGS